MTALDTAAGYRRLVDGSAWFELPRDVIRVAGPDAVSYLQGQLSQDIEGLAVGDAAWSLVLQPQGRVDAWLRVWRRAGDELILDVDAGWGEATLSRLARFKLRTKAEMERLVWSCLAVRGAVPDPPAGSIPARWPLVGGFDIVGPEPAAPGGLEQISLASYEVRRIEAGLPRMGSELSERTIPAEAGVVDASVSFTKGCYTGQELVARIDSRGGHVPRQLRVVFAPGDVPAPGTELLAGERSVGTVTSSAAHPDGGAVALAFVHRDVTPPAEVSCGGQPARVEAAPRA